MAGPRKNCNGVPGAYFFQVRRGRGFPPQPLPYLPYPFVALIRHAPYFYQSRKGCCAGDMMCPGYPKYASFLS